MTEIPFLNYHTSLLISKLRNGEDITAHDVNQAIYGSAINRLVEPYFAYNARKTVAFRGYKANIRRNNAYLRGVRRVANATSYQTRTKRFSTFQGRKRPVYYYFGKRGRQFRSLRSRSVRSKRWVRYSYPY